VDLKQWLILAAGVGGIIIVALCPRWLYPPHPLMPRQRYIGYRFITQPPEPVSIVKEENGRRIFYADQFIAPRVDRADLSLRIGLIITLVVAGLGILRAKQKFKIGSRGIRL
jgi:hypothetical protein